MSEWIHTISFYIIALLVCYFIGSIPFAYLIGKINGVDIRKCGSGNVGSTNVTRTLGKKWGVPCFFCDFFKGFIPVFIIKLIIYNQWISAEFSVEILSSLAICAVTIGHIFPIFLCFKGGKGVATVAGAILALAPVAVIIGLFFWGLFFYCWKYVSLASILAACIVPIIAWVSHFFPLLTLSNYFKLSIIELFTLSILAFLVIIKHYANIQRLLNGTENKFTKSN